MKPTVQLAEMSTPEGSHLALFAHDGHYFLQGDGVPLMTSFSHGAEEHLARMGCAPFRAAGQPRILLGGLGLGYTLAAATQALPQKRAAFIVAELIPELEQWNREHLADLHPGLWEDPRIQVRTAGLCELMQETGQGYHAILLDTANGPEICTGAKHDDPCAPDRLQIAGEALKEGGLLAISSATADSSLEKRLRNAGFDVTRELVPAVHKGKQKRHHFIWLARKGSYQSQHQRRSQ